jgi:hypothetical protein
MFTLHVAVKRVIATQHQVTLLGVVEVVGSVLNEEEVSGQSGQSGRIQGNLSSTCICP